MAPPMRMASALPRKFWMSSILSLTLAPPKITTRGLSGLSVTLVRALSSFSMRKPAATRSLGKRATMPLTEAWARWAEPKASFT